MVTYCGQCEVKNVSNAAIVRQKALLIGALAANCKFCLTFWTSPGLRSHLASIHAFASHTLAVLHKCPMQYSPCFFFADALHGIIIFGDMFISHSGGSIFAAIVRQKSLLIAASVWQKT